MEFGLSSGEDSDEDDTAPAGFEEAVKNEEGWVNLENATNVPTIMLRNIHSYFIQRRIKKEHVTATKPFEKGFRIYAAHKVQTISLKAVTTSTYTVVKAAVRPSQRQDRTYQAYIASETNGTILHATCTCIAGSCGACNHTAAVMFAIDEHSRVSSNTARPSCTSLPAQWPIPRAPSTSHAVEDMQVVKPKYNKTSSPPTRKRPPILTQASLVTLDRVKQLKADLSKQYDGQLLFHQVWPHNIDTIQEQQLLKQISQDK